MPEEIADKTVALILPLRMMKTIAEELDYAAGVRRELSEHCPTDQKKELGREAEDSEVLASSFRWSLNEALNPTPWF